MDQERDRDLPKESSIADWGRRVSAARARLTSAFPSHEQSALQRESRPILEELTLAVEELQVAEEELQVQTEELSTSRAMLEAEQRRYRTLFEHAPVPYVVTNHEGLITDANRAAASLFRVALERLPGKPLVVFVNPARRRAFRDQLNSLAAKNVEIGLLLRIRPRTGGMRSVTASVGVVRNREGAVTELRWLLVDETMRRRREHRVRSLNAELTSRVDERTAELKRAMEAQQELARVAARASREKSELIAIVSHELRTPLAAIGGYVELLALGVRGPLSAAQQADIQRIQQAQSHILHLLEDLVGYSKLETGHLSVETSDVIVRDALDAVASLVRPQAGAKGVTIELIANELDVVARADEERLRQILINLLGNAIKFTPAGGHVSVSWSIDDAAVRILIRDDGIGIPPDKLETVFEPYVRLVAPHTTRTLGWGLGLAISRELARAMGGDLTAASSADEGTTFTLQLPRSTRIALIEERD